MQEGNTPTTLQSYGQWQHPSEMTVTTRGSLQEGLRLAVNNQKIRHVPGNASTEPGYLKHGPGNAAPRTAQVRV